MSEEPETIQRGVQRPRTGRLPLRVVGLAGFLAVAALAIAVAALSSRGAPAFAGTDLDPPREALPFQLTDQLGETVSLTDFSDKVVVLTFLYTSCLDVCPLTTAKLYQAHRLLGEDAGGVVFLAVTVDPERDTVEQAYDYSLQRDMLDKWHFLVGSEAELEPLWNYYWVGDIRQEVVGAEEESPAASASDLNGDAGAYVVDHSAPIHIIADGGVRVVFGSTFLSSELAHDLQLLLR